MDKKLDLCVGFNFGFTWLLSNTLKEDLQSKWPVETLFYNDYMRFQHKQLVEFYFYNCWNLPFFGGGAKRPLGWAKGASSIEGKRVESPPMFIWGKHRKNQKEKVKGMWILKIRVRESFTHGEGISTLRVRHKGRQPLIECANHELHIIYFPFFCLFSFFVYFIFF